MLDEQILVVAPTPSVADRLRSSLASAGYGATVVPDFARAKHEMTARVTELLITELKLGEFNGLHLAIRAGCQGTPAIVIGEPDPLFEAEAAQLGAQYLSASIQEEELIPLLRSLLIAARCERGHLAPPIGPLDDDSQLDPSELH
ncbi:MAG: response regulator [Acidobacteria bacterium]|nr:response regulator [Acidobacteriota bacterium]